jgi:hypothetical protein
MRSRVKIARSVLGPSCLLLSALSASMAWAQQPPPPAWTPIDSELPVDRRAHVVESSAGSAYGVSSQKLKLQGWNLKPVYTQRPGGVQVVGYLAWPESEVIVGDNPRAIWYERPNDDCASWVSVAYTSGTAWNAVVALKQRFGIDDSVDAIWEIPVVAPIEGDDSQPRVFQQGVPVEDPLLPLVNSLPPGPDLSVPGPRGELLGVFQDAGYAAADVPFERMGPARAAQFFANQTRFFEVVIGRTLSASEFAAVAQWAFGSSPAPVAPGTQPPPPPGAPGGPDWPAFPKTVPLPPDPLWTGQPCPNMPEPAWFGCDDSEYYGPWIPTEAPCDCETLGPSSLSIGEVSANAEGVITIWIPVPPPQGSTLKITVGVGFKAKWKLCYWSRRCWANAKRTTFYRSKTDCVWRYGPDEAWSTKKLFEAVYYQVSSPEDSCATAIRPAECPPPNWPCALSISTAPAPPQQP